MSPEGKHFASPRASRIRFLVSLLLKLRATGRACEWDNVAEIRNPGDKHEHALKAQTETGVRHCSVTAKIEIPFVIGRIHFVPAHVFFQDIEPFFALAATDNLANVGYEPVQSGHGC